jgi:hypothetical protein
VTGTHCDGPVADGRANGQLFYSDADDGVHTLGNRSHSVGAARGISMSAHTDYSESSFEPESNLPSQLFDGWNKNEALEPIKRLMLAVTDAVRCYQVGADAQKSSRRQAFREAEEWLFRTISDSPSFHSKTCVARLI